jgi:hypothetical protein
MAYTKTLAVFMTVVAILLSACSNRKAEVPFASEPASRSAARPVQGQPQAEEPTLESILAFYNIDECVSDNAFANPLENSVELDMWVEKYRRGIPGKAAVFFNGLVVSSSLRVLESHGGASYSITLYEVADNGIIKPPQKYESSVVVKRAYDYVFGADWPKDIDIQPVAVHRVPALAFEDTDWNPETGPPIDAIAFEDAEGRAKEVGERFYRYASILPSFFAGGHYLRDSVLDAAEGTMEGSPAPVAYKTVGAMQIGGAGFYIIHGNVDQDALNRGEHGGSVTAVSTDGRLVFMQSMEDGNWIFVDDAEQEMITPQ